MRSMILCIGTALVAAALVSCGDESISKKAGGKITTSLCNFTEGASNAIDAKSKIAPIPSEAFTKAGLELTDARLKKVTENGKENQYAEIYVIAARPVKGTLRLKAFNAAHKEIGRAELKKNCAADTAGYEKFLMPDELNISDAAAFELDLLPDQSEAQGE